MNSSASPTLSPLDAAPEYQIGDRAPRPNQGRSANTHHWRRVDGIAAALRRSGFRNIRVDQQQVRAGRVAGYNRPDIQAVSPAGRRVIVEVDTEPAERRRHYRVITGVDPQARSVFVRIHPETGQTINRIVYIPGRGPNIRQGAFRLDDVLPRPAAWKARRRARPVRR